MSKKYPKRKLEWFLKRIGKPIYRKDTKEYSVIVSDKNHARMLEMYQNDLDLYYKDKPFS